MPGTELLVVGNISDHPYPWPEGGLAVPGAVKIIMIFHLIIAYEC